MPIPTDYKDTMDYQMIGGLDEDGEAQELTFEGSRVVIDSGDCYWKDRRYEYSGESLIYKGLNVVHKAETTAETWYIWKYTWSGDNMTRCEGPLTGQWDNRASLAWA